MIEQADPRAPYQGYSNAATWSVALHFSNDRALYAAVRRKRHWHAWQVRALGEQHFGQPFRDCPEPWAGKMADVNWQEIADEFNAE